MGNSKCKEHSTLLYSYAYNNLYLVLSHPLDRLKVAVQLDLQSSQYGILKSFFTGQYRSLYTGFPSCFLQQNAKILYWTACMSYLPNEIDKYQFNFVTSSLLKGFAASVVDTVISSPFENIKTRQMNFKEPVSTLKMAKTIYRQSGVPGFFAGSCVSVAKSLPSWTYLFLGYQATKDMREREDLLSTLLWATAASLPIAALTSPLDVIKSQIQGSFSEQKESSWSIAKNVYHKYGLSSLWRGFPFRLSNKSLLTATSYLILDINEENKARTYP